MTATTEKPEFRIEKGVPLEPRPGGQAKYPFTDMEVGDSFFIAGFGRGVRQAAFAHGKKYGVKFAVRKQGEGFRCWRVG